MIELKCDRCGRNCDLNASVIDIRVIHNPNPVRFSDIGEIRLTDDTTHIRYMLCQSCYAEQGLPNLYRTGEKLAEGIKNSGVVHAEWVCCDDKLYDCSECGGVVGDTIYKFCPYCGARMNNSSSDHSRKESENNV